MSMVTYPLNDIEYTAEDAELFHSTRTSGVFANNSFDYLISGEDNTIVIGPGIAWIKNSEFSGKVVANKEQVTLVLDLPDANYPRIDAVVIQFSANENGSTIIAKPGVASSTPVPPSVVRTESVYELHLFQILRNPADTAISPANITDVRLDRNYCGIMADSVTQIDTEAIEAQISELIGNLRDEISEVKDGSSYLFRDGSNAMAGSLDMGGNRVKNVGNPTEDGDAVPKSYVDAKTGMALLWENASPSSAFARQTVALNLADFAGVFITYRNQTTGSVYNTTGFIGKGDGFALIYVPSVASSVAVTRKGTVDANGVNFLESSNDNNNYQIPLKIYGVGGAIV